MNSKRVRKNPKRPSQYSTPMSQRRIWLFRSIAAIFVPVLLLLTLELGLRIAGFGYSTWYFQAVPGRPAYLMGNPKFGWSYFPPEIARQPEPFIFPREKGPKTIRVFFIGSSAALGFPEPAFSMARILDAMLRERFPDVRIEVINTSMVAINSHTGVAIGSDAAMQAGDLYIVYEGNNEVVGPWGPGTVFAGFTPRRNVIRAAQAIKSFRIGQLANRLRYLSHGQNTIKEWAGMELFLDNKVPSDDPRLNVTAQQFRDNLSAICRIVHAKASAPVILCTVGVNLRDCPPFASEHRSDLTKEDRQRWENHFARAIAAQAVGDCETAFQELKAADQIDDHYAELHFRAGQCLLALNRADEAKDRFARARDFDCLRFRTDSRLNETIRTVATKHTPNAHLVDIEQIMASPEVSQHGIPGDELFLEHCHLTFEGNYVVARALFQEAVAILPQDVLSQGDGATEPPSLEECAQLLGFTDHARANVLRAVVELLMEHPPFVFQMDHERSLERIQGMIADLTAAATPDAVQSWRADFEIAVGKAPEDWLLRRQFGGYLLEMGDLNGSEQQLRRSLEVMPLDVLARQALGAVLLLRGNAVQAIRQYEQAIASPFASARQRSDLQFNMGVAEEKRGRDIAAEDHFRLSLKEDPRNVKAMTNLGLLLTKQQKVREAETLFRQVLVLAPEMPLTHVNMAMVLSAQNRFADAIKELEEVARLQPNSPDPWFSIANLQLKLGRHQEVIASLQTANGLAPDHVEVKVQLGKLYVLVGDLAAAEAQFVAALQIDPDHEIARSALEIVHARRGSTSQSPSD